MPMIPEETTFIEMAALVAIFLITIAMLLTFWRLARGPDMPDRVVALDLFAALMIGFIASICMLTGKSIFLNAAAVLAMIAFLGTVAIARYLERGVKHDF